LTLVPPGKLASADARLFRRLVGHRSPPADYVLWAASRAASRSLLWLAIAGLLAARGNRDGRRAAARGVVAIAIASAITNGPLKLAWRRHRPVASGRVPSRGLISTPASSSFPSGHAASAFAFATAASAELPALTLSLGALALTVAYSRVHTGVHYPGDVLAGAAAGVAAGIASGRLFDAAGRRRSQGEVPRWTGSEVPRRVVLVLNPRSGTAHRRDRALGRWPGSALRSRRRSRSRTSTG
jgi:membrane-associated phospholipid phosphatase